MENFVNLPICPKNTNSVHFQYYLAMDGRLNTAFALKKILGQNLTFSIRAFVVGRPRIYFSTLPFLRKDPARRIDRDTKMVIAGIWGCANTFASAAFVLRQPNLSVSHHLHIPAQVIQAARYKIPCLVMVRHPIDAIASLTSRGGMEFTVEGFRWALKDYAYFYESIFRYKEHYVVAEFKEIVTNYPASIQRVNERFGTRFQVPENDSDEAKQVLGTHKYRSSRRPYEIEYVKECLQSPILDKYRIRAETAYQDFCVANDVPMRKDPARPPTASRETKELKKMS